MYSSKAEQVGRCLGKVLAASSYPMLYLYIALLNSGLKPNFKIDEVYLTTPDSVSVVHVLVWFGAGVRFERGYCCLFVFCFFCFFVCCFLF